MPTPTFSELNDASQCGQYFQDLSTVADLPTACRLTRNFRTLYPNFAKGFVIDKKVLTDLLAQNGGNISGIKFYIGFDTNSVFFTAVAVATVGINYDDFSIPTSEASSTYSILGEVRPCPIHCGKSNALNS